MIKRFWKAVADFDAAVAVGNYEHARRAYVDASVAKDLYELNRESDFMARVRRWKRLKRGAKR